MSTKAIGFRLNAIVVAKIAKMAKRLKLSKTQVMNLAIDRLYESERGKS
jgi:hypothetical protein